MSGAPRLRPACAEDAAAIRRLVRGARLNPIGLDWRRFVVLEAEGEVVGCVQVKPHRDGSRELASLVVAPGWRGRGLGRRLVEAVLERHPPPLYLTCRSGLMPFYERFGFREVGETEPQPPYFRRVRRLGRLLRGLRRRGEYLAVMVWEGAQPPSRARS